MIEVLNKDLVVKVVFNDLKVKVEKEFVLFVNDVLIFFEVDEMFILR